MEKQTLTLPTGVGMTTDLAWSPDGTQLAAVTDCGRLVVWHTSTGAIQVNQHLGRTHLLTVAWAYHGRALAVGGANGALYRMERLTDPKVTTHFLAHPVTHVAWSRSPVGRCLVVSGHTLTVLDGRGLPPVTKQYATPILDAGWSPDGRTLALVCETGPIEVWDMEPFVQVFTLSHIPDPCCLAWQRDGRHVSIGTTTGSIQVCHVRTQRHTLWSQVSTSPIHALKWGERYLAVASQTAQREFRLLDEDGQTYPQPVTHVFTWNPQGTVLARGLQQHIALAPL